MSTIAVQDGAEALSCHIFGKKLPSTNVQERVPEKECVPDALPESELGGVFISFVNLQPGLQEVAPSLTGTGKQDGEDSTRKEEAMRELHEYTPTDQVMMV